MRKIVLLIAVLFSLQPIFSQVSVDWDETYGGEKNDGGNKIYQTVDGGYLVLGYTDSQGSGKKDGWAVKLSQTGEQQWEMTYGGEENEELFDAVEFEGGYLFVGYTASKGAGDDDYWLIRVDNEGKQDWDTTYGGKDSDIANKIMKGIDGNYIITGESKSFSAGAKDIWIINIDLKSMGKGFGKILWKKNIGGDANDFPNNMKWNPNDSLYYIIANSGSFGNGGNDAWLLAVSPDRANVKMKRSYGYKNYESANDFLLTSDGYAIMAGSTLSKGSGLNDGWILKLADGFDEEYEKFFGGIKEDQFINIYKTDKGYLLVGNTQSIGEGRYDLWLMMVNSKLEKLWETNIGDLKDDKISNSIIDKDGYLVACGTTFSKGNGAWDMWVVRINLKK